MTWTARKGCVQWTRAALCHPTHRQRAGCLPETMYADPLQHAYSTGTPVNPSLLPRDAGQSRRSSTPILSHWWWCPRQPADTRAGCTYIQQNCKILHNSQNCNCNNILNPLKLLFLLDWRSEQVTLISVANLSNLRYLFMTSLSCGSCTNGQSRSGLERLRQEHNPVISQGLEAANFCFLRQERKKVNFWILSQVRGWRYPSVLVHCDTILFFPLAMESWKCQLRLWFNCACISIFQVWLVLWRSENTTKKSLRNSDPEETRKIKSLWEKEKLAGRFLGHDIIISSAWRLFEAYPICTFWGLPIIKRWLLLTPVHLCRLAQKMLQRQDFALSAQSS